MDSRLCIAEQIGDLLRRRGWRLAVAESCTGGLLGYRLTAVPGSSEYFLGGVIAYANLTKERLLGVPAGLLAEHGAVSEAVARAMAAGVQSRLGAEIGLSVTGIAGPGGGTAEKPVGLVFVGLIGPGIDRCERFRFEGGRAALRREAGREALQLLHASLSGTC